MLRKSALLFACVLPAALPANAASSGFAKIKPSLALIGRRQALDHGLRNRLLRHDHGDEVVLRHRQSRRDRRAGQRRGQLIRDLSEEPRHPAQGQRRSA